MSENNTTPQQEFQNVAPGTKPVLDPNKDYRKVDPFAMKRPADEFPGGFGGNALNLLKMFIALIFFPDKYPLMAEVYGYGVSDKDKAETEKRAQDYNSGKVSLKDTVNGAIEHAQAKENAKLSPEQKQQVQPDALKKEIQEMEFKHTGDTMTEPKNMKATTPAPSPTQEATPSQ